MKSLLLFIAIGFFAQVALSQDVFHSNGNVLIDANGQEFHVQGMNYGFQNANWPLPANNPQGIWQRYWNIRDSIDHELVLAESLKVNAVRFFIHYSSLGGGEIADSTINKIKDFVNLCDNHHMKAIPTLFDFDYSYLPNSYSFPHKDSVEIRNYLTKIVKAFDNQTYRSKILAYDIKNEIDSDTLLGLSSSDLIKWAKSIASQIRKLDSVDHLITIGLKDYRHYNLGFDSIVDFASFHWFDDSLPAFPTALSTIQSVTSKPIVVEEFGKETFAARTEQDQAAVYNAVISQSQASHIAGYMFWTLDDFLIPPTANNENERHMGILKNINVTHDTANYSPKKAAGLVMFANCSYWTDNFSGLVASQEAVSALGWSVDNSSSVTFKTYWETSPGVPHPFSPDSDCVAITKTGSINDSAIARSPLLVNVDVSKNDTLWLKINKYTKLDTTWGDTCVLDVGLVLQGNPQIIWLDTGICSNSIPAQRGGANRYQFPHMFSYSLLGKLGTSGTVTFQVLFRLRPLLNPANHGYAASFVLDWIRLKGTQCTVPIQNHAIAKISKTIFLSHGKNNPQIIFDILEPSNVNLTIYNLSGKKIETLLNGRKDTGRYKITWNTRSRPNGTFVCKLTCGGKLQTTRIVLQR